MNFFFKVLRNSLILAAFVFFTDFTSYKDLCLEKLEPLIKFVGLYIAAELALYYKVSINMLPTRKRTAIKTFIF